MRFIFYESGYYETRVGENFWELYKDGRCVIPSWLSASTMTTSISGVTFPTESEFPETVTHELGGVRLFWDRLKKRVGI